ncbi:MAG: energy transducer TonB [Aquificae bacterium]|nr:energy transducer TonB [Aquificota bacterium]
MVRYLAISFFINLLLFFVYSYWVSKAINANFFKGLEEIHLPLKVFIKHEEISAQQLEQKNVALKGKEEKSTTERQKKLSKPSLLTSLLPTVEKEYKTIFRKISLKGRAKLTKGGEIELNLNRKVVYMPKIQPIKVEVPPAPAVVKITVLPDGRVINPIFIKRSGNAKVDTAILNFVRNLRFEPINEPIIQEITITFQFKVQS